jgi:hypothetical protein
MKHKSKELVLMMAKINDDTFPVEFVAWLEANFHIWKKFVEIAHEVIDAGHKHYSSRTIIEVIRHHTALAEDAGEYKLNDHTTPYLSRLFAEIYPAHHDLFAFRVTNLEKAAA